MFRVISPPIIRSTYNCIYSIWYLLNIMDKNKRQIYDMKIYFIFMVPCIVTLYINKILQDATVCRYLFTAKSLYMFRVSIAHIIRSTQNCNCSLWYRSLLCCYCDLYQRLQLQFYVLLMMGAMDTRKM
jgi:hypothetical protein